MSSIRGVANAIMLVALFAAFVLAEVPQTITYQGRLLDSEGDPVDEAKLMNFIIWKDATSTETSNKVWESGFHVVPVSVGLFEVQLGTPPMPVFLHDMFLNDTNLYLGITVDTDAEIDPRTKLASVGFSYQSLRSDTAGYSLDMADGSVTTAKIADYSVTTLKIENLGVTNEKLAADCVTEDKIADDAVTTLKIENLGVTNEKLAADCVTEDKIADDAVTDAQIVTAGVTTDEIANGTILLEDLGQNGAVDGQIMKWSAGAWSLSQDNVGSGNGWVDIGNNVVLETTTDSVGIGVSDPQYKLDVDGTIHADVIGDTDVRGVYGRAELSGYTGLSYGLYGEAYGEGSLAFPHAVYGKAQTGPGAIQGIGIYGTSEGNAIGHVGVMGQVNEGNRQVGVWGTANGETAIDSSIGVLGTVAGIGDTPKYGIYGSAAGNSSAAKYGVYGRATYPGPVNYGVYGYADGGAVNWAGYFEGDARITGDLTLDGNLNISVPFNITDNVASPNAIIEGYNEGTGVGVYGEHTTTGNYGYLGTSLSGVYGYCVSNNFGFLGTANEGVYGYGATGSGVTGYASSSGEGVYGSNVIGTIGILGNATAGVYGETGGGTYAGQFNGDVDVTVDVTVGNNISSASMNTDDHNIGSSTQDGTFDLFRSGTPYSVVESRPSPYGALFRLWDESGVIQTHGLLADIDGDGGNFIVYGNNTNTSYFQVDGNYGGSGDPQISIVGSGSSSYIDAGSSGNSSVLLPNDAIASAEIFNEPGITQGKANGSVELTGYTTEMIDVVTVTIDIPAPGYIVLEAGGQFSISGTTGSNYIYCQIDETAGGSNLTYYRQRVGYYAPPNTSLINLSISTRRVYYKSSADSYTFRLEAMDMTGTGTKYIYNPVITAMYIPTSYGTVSTIVSSAEAAEFEDAVQVSVSGMPEEEAGSETGYMVDLRELELKVARAEAETERLKRELIQQQMEQQMKSERSRRQD